MNKQIPCGPDDEMCHRLMEVCSKVCYNPQTKIKCKLWKQFSGKDAFGNDCNGWFCVDEMASGQLAELAKETNRNYKMLEEMRNMMNSAKEAAVQQRLAREGRNDYIQLG